MEVKRAFRVKKPPKIIEKKKRVKKVAAPPPKRLMQLPKLKPKMINAIDNWFKNGGNALEAAREAGYSGAAVFGREEVQAEINKRQNRLRKKTEVTEERVIAELAKVAFGGIGDMIEVNEDGSAYLDFNEMTADQRATITEFSSDSTFIGRGKGKAKVLKQRVKFASKMDALQQLSRILGMNQDKTTVKLEADEAVVNALMAGRKRAALISKNATDADFEMVD